MPGDLTVSSGPECRPSRGGLSGSRTHFGEGVEMTMTRKLTGAAIAAAAAGLFAMGHAAPVLAADDAGKVKCEGVNSCKGKGDCSSAKNSCQGKNACKGQGFMEMSKADCEKAKAAMPKDSK